MKADKCAANSSAVRNKEGQEEKFLRRFDGDGINDIVIAIAVWGRGKWEIEVRLPSGHIRRRNNKSKKN